jgi:hypothetical protein
MLDWSHVGNSPEHTDAAIRGCGNPEYERFTLSAEAPGPDESVSSGHPAAAQTVLFFPDQLLTLAMAAGVSAADWAVAREVGAPITVHVNGAGQLQPVAAALGRDVTLVHANNLTEAEWQLAAKTGVSISIASPIEMEMGHGIPAIQQAIDHGIRPSLSVDVETQMPGDFFTQMRSVFTLQRMLRQTRDRAGQKTCLPADGP